VEVVNVNQSYAMKKVAATPGMMVEELGLTMV